MTLHHPPPPPPPPHLPQVWLQSSDIILSLPQVPRVTRLPLRAPPSSNQPHTSYSNGEIWIILAAEVGMTRSANSAWKQCIYCFSSIQQQLQTIHQHNNNSCDQSPPVVSLSIENVNTIALLSKRINENTYQISDMSGSVNVTVQGYVPSNFKV